MADYLNYGEIKTGDHVKWKWEKTNTVGHGIVEFICDDEVLPQDTEIVIRIEARWGSCGWTAKVPVRELTQVSPGYPETLWSLDAHRDNCIKGILDHVNDEGAARNIRDACDAYATALIECPEKYDALRLMNQHRSRARDALDS